MVPFKLNSSIVWLYVRLPLKMMTCKLQLVLNTAAHMLSAKPSFHLAVPLLQELYWLPLILWVQFKVLLISYKARYGLGPGYLKGHLVLQTSAWALRSFVEGFLRHSFQSLGCEERDRWPSLPQPHLASLTTPPPTVGKTALIFRRQIRQISHPLGAPSLLKRWGKPK